MKLIFATNNHHKVAEVQEMLGDRFRIIIPRQMGILGEIPEDGATLADNALQKARYVYDLSGEENCFADDTGLEVDVLGGSPGVYSARYAGRECNAVENRKLLLLNMKHEDNRRARFRTVIALILNGQEHLFEGEVRGTILHEEAGDGGFGYDPLFVPDGYESTFAQMTLEEKGAISHRGAAVRKLTEFLHTLKTE